MSLRTVVFLLIFGLAAGGAAAQVANGELQIHHIDMGQGDAAVLISPGGQVVLFDAGKDIANKKNCDVETDYLDQLGVTQIDYIFVSHYHTDHIGCIPAVLKQFPLRGPSYDRGEDYSTPFYKNYVTAVTTAHRTTVTLGQTTTLDGGTNPVKLTVLSLNGTSAGGHVPTTNENDLSVSVLVSFGDFREEIGGDLSGENTSNYQDIETDEAPSVGPIDVYKVHHHCSAYSTNEAWLKTTQPTVAIISTGDGNVYRHPAESCLERLHDSDVSKAYWTETGAGGSPGANDVIGGDIVVKVAPNATSYTVSYNNGKSTDTYQIKGSAANAAAPVVSLNPEKPDQPRYAYSVKGLVYYYTTCPAVQRISKDNLRTSVDPPSGYKPSSCVQEAVQP
jgi:beta-lactamase superfamily II metal-dependent hydrolase